MIYEIMKDKLGGFNHLQVYDNNKGESGEGRVERGK
jgi:hypothetical protein